MRNSRSPRTERRTPCRARMKGRGEQAAAGHGQEMAGEEAHQIGRIDGRGKNQRRQKICIEKKADDEDRDGGDACQEKPAIRDWQGRQNEDIEQVGKEQVPLEDGDNAHGNKGIEDKEEMMIHLQPIRRWAHIEGHARRPSSIKGDRRAIDTTQPRIREVRWQRRSEPGVPWRRRRARRFRD